MVEHATFSAIKPNEEGRDSLGTGILEVALGCLTTSCGEGDGLRCLLMPETAAARRLYGRRGVSTGPELLAGRARVLAPACRARVGRALTAGSSSAFRNDPRGFGPVQPSADAACASGRGARPASSSGPVDPPPRPYKRRAAASSGKSRHDHSLSASITFAATRRKTPQHQLENARAK
eukprot:244963-Chlamydomonas_euryale.AAC.1